MMKILYNQKITLYCLPYAGGHTLSYRDFQAYMAETVLIKPLELPGRGSSNVTGVGNGVGVGGLNGLTGGLGQRVLNISASNLGDGVAVLNLNRDNLDLGVVNTVLGGDLTASVLHGGDSRVGNGVSNGSNMGNGSGNGVSDGSGGITGISVVSISVGLGLGLSVSRPLAVVSAGARDGDVGGVHTGGGLEARITSVVAETIGVAIAVTGISAEAIAVISVVSIGISLGLSGSKQGNCDSLEHYYQVKIFPKSLFC